MKYQNLLSIVLAAKGIIINDQSGSRFLLKCFRTELNLSRSVDIYSKSFHKLLEETETNIFPIMESCDHRNDYEFAGSWNSFFDICGKETRGVKLTTNSSYSKTTFISNS